MCNLQSVWYMYIALKHTLVWVKVLTRTKQTITTHICLTYITHLLGERKWAPTNMQIRIHNSYIEQKIHSDKQPYYIDIDKRLGVVSVTELCRPTLSHSYTTWSKDRASLLSPISSYTKMWKRSGAGLTRVVHKAMIECGNLLITFQTFLCTSQWHSPVITTTISADIQSPHLCRRVENVQGLL